MVREGRRDYGIIPLNGQAVASAKRRDLELWEPGGLAMTSWDAGTGAATEISMPEGGFAVVQRSIRGEGGRGSRAGGGTPRAVIRDCKPKAASLASGEYDQAGELVSAAVV